MDLIDSHRMTFEQKGGTIQYRKYWSRDIDSLLKDMAGKILVDTVPKDVRKLCPAWNSPFAGLSGVESFRGKRLSYCSLLPEQVIEDAYLDRSTDEMLHYADTIESHLPDKPPFDYAALDKKLQINPELHDSNKIPDLYYDMKTIHDAKDWLGYWAKHPVKLHAWYK